MSQENVEIVRDQFRDTNEGDFERVMLYWTDDIEIYPTRADALEAMGLSE
jgi:hypothetical protein